MCVRCNTCVQVRERLCVRVRAYVCANVCPYVDLCVGAGGSCACRENSRVAGSQYRIAGDPTERGGELQVEEEMGEEEEEE